MDFLRLLRPDTSPATKHEPAPQLLPIHPQYDPNRILANLQRITSNLTSFVADSLTPWDFDRHEPGLSFTTKWIYTDKAPAITGERPTVVKFTSTIVPLEKEWKVSARTKLMEFGEKGVVFGKAGIYLFGEQSLYAGIEADHVWNIPQFEKIKLYANVNYRTSRKPNLDPFHTSIGLQRDFETTNGVTVTMRLGINPLERNRLLITPVPDGSYF